MVSHHAMTFGSVPSPALASTPAAQRLSCVGSPRAAQEAV